MMNIYINIGHSDTDPGAVGYETERELAVKVSQYQRDYLLEHYECNVRMNPGTMGNLYDIAKDANEWGADLFVSNHFNASKGDGYEALVYSEKRRDLGEVFEKHIKAIGQNSRGVKLRPGLIVLNSTNMPAVLNEGAFVDNLKDIQDWNEDHELKKLGEAYAKATAEFLGLEKKAADIMVMLPTLQMGSEGEPVKTLQRLLTAFGYYKGTVDGSFGELTQTAVKTFQKATGIGQDGAVGKLTWPRLLGV